MALPVRDQVKYWGVAFVVLLALLWGLGSVILPFIAGRRARLFHGPGGRPAAAAGPEPDRGDAR